MNAILASTKQEFDKALDFLERELTKIRTGRASPALVEDIQVEAFGKRMPLKQLAAISCPEPRQILIQPWDVSYLEPIEKALQKADLGTSPIVDKNMIRVHLPSLTQEYRQNLAKLLSLKGEQTKQVMRRWREQAWGTIQDKVRKGELREGDKFKGKEELQKLLDENTKKIEELLERKLKEIQL
ncbi:MAG: ribosome recycling factor [Parcubacteria group bacterium Greene0714_21]|nr:MAG: ribosome recycling factor [Parcubacteria group bacterium Greene0416_39]TSC97737.1 MAG: ribosome recycling factor [Parcubacteria group bacterium Greene1014_47]TSD04340.1 MAG: ribosome recycling factor [Parcubacteria group bacterium Greene0714_21]